MRVIHLATTPLAGAPIRLVQALRKHAGIDSRLINLDPLAYGTRTFPEDLVWADNHEEAISLIEKADILHFHHHWFDPASPTNPFGLNFCDVAPKTCKFIYQHHSTPKNLSMQTADDKPLLVIPHCAERYFPTARIVPNIIDLESTPQNLDSPTALTFAPSILEETAWAHRWHTKAAPETIAILKTMSAKRSDFRWTLIANQTYADSIRAKQASDIVLEETATGSYHQGSLEGLALGKTVIAYADERSRYILARLTGTSLLPFFNTRLEELQAVLPGLISDKARLHGIGAEARRWYETYYAPAPLTRFFTEAYEDLLVSEACFKEKTALLRQADFGATAGGTLIDLSETVWQSRKRRNCSLRQKTRDRIFETKQRLRIIKRSIWTITGRTPSSHPAAEETP